VYVSRMRWALGGERRTRMCGLAPYRWNQRGMQRYLCGYITHGDLDLINGDDIAPQLELGSVHKAGFVHVPYLDPIGFSDHERLRARRCERWDCE
jgi:hypothetical protein